MIASAFIFFTILTGFLVFQFRRVWIANPAIMFLAFNWIIGTGIIIQLDPTSSVDLTHLAVLFISLAGFGLGAFAALFSARNISTQRSYQMYRSFWRSRDVGLEAKSFRLAMVFFIVSAFITILYYQAVGYNLTLIAFNPAIDDATTARLNAYAGDQYFAPGIVNQFKNSILPITFLFLASSIRSTWLKTIFLLISVPFLIYALAGTGQRTFIVIFLIMAVISSIALNRGRVRAIYIILPSIFTVLLFVLLSTLLGRAGDGFFEVLGEIIHRIFASNQYAAVHGFRFIQQEGNQYGMDWWQSVVGLLPGVKGSDIANRIFADIFGGDRGTAPLSVWGSVYYNFGIIGVLPISLLIGFLYSKSYFLLLQGSYEKLRIICFSAFFVYLSIWIAGSPVQLLNNGLLAVILLLFFRRYSFRL